MPEFVRLGEISEYIGERGQGVLGCLVEPFPRSNAFDPLAMTARSIAPNFIVVIRTAGERTFETCKSLVLNQVPESCLHIVNERPFEAALRRCYQIGIESNADWMITLDADVLLRERAIQGLLAEAAAMPSNHFQIEGRVFDKLTHRVRWASHRCYRTRLLPLALEKLPKNKTVIRPESTTINWMAANGYPSHKSNQVYGIHDFEQFYADIYRKARIHAVKHKLWLGEMMLHWYNMASKDADFKIAIQGAADGLCDPDSATIDSRMYSEHAQSTLAKLKLNEKSPLEPTSIFEGYVETTLEFANKSRDILWLAHDGNSLHERFRSRLGRLGILRFIPYTIGAAMIDIGTHLKRIAEHANK